MGTRGALLHKLLIVLLLLSLACSIMQKLEVTDEEANIALGIALQLVDTPYVLGGQSSNGIDCSGLVIYSYQEAMGNRLWFWNGKQYVQDITAQEFFNYNCRILNFEDVRAGDLVFICEEGKDIPEHIGLLIKWISNDTVQIIHASGYYSKVVIEDWKIDEIKRNFYIKDFGRLEYYYISSCY